jgi:molecular chaperone GrpE
MGGKPDRATSEDTTGQAAAEPATVSRTVGDASAPGATEATEDPAALRARAEENWDKYVRAVAELDNVRKRTARDVENARKYALERFATDLLAVRDSFEMGLAAAGNADTDSLLEGSRATLKQLASTMERFGVTEIDPQGEPFDPTHHEAMMTQPSVEVEPGTVLSVYQKGYLLNGRLLRPARVVVAAAPDREGR